MIMDVYEVSIPSVPDFVPLRVVTENELNKAIEQANAALARNGERLALEKSTPTVATEKVKRL